MLKKCYNKFSLMNATFMANGHIYLTGSIYFNYCAYYLNIYKDNNYLRSSKFCFRLK